MMGQAAIVTKHTMAQAAGETRSVKVQLLRYLDVQL